MASFRKPPPSLSLFSFFSFYQLGWLLLSLMIFLSVVIEYFGMSWFLQRPVIHWLHQMTQTPEAGVTLVILPEQGPNPNNQTETFSPPKIESQDIPGVLQKDPQISFLSPEDVGLTLRAVTSFHPKLIALTHPLGAWGSAPLTQLHEALESGWVGKIPFLVGKPVPLLGTLETPPTTEPAPSQLPLPEQGAPADVTPAPSITPPISNLTPPADTPTAPFEQNTTSGTPNLSPPTQKGDTQQPLLWPCWQRLEILRLSWLHLQGWNLPVIPGESGLSSSLAPLWGEEAAGTLPLLARLEDGSSVGSLWWRILFLMATSPEAEEASPQVESSFLARRQEATKKLAQIPILIGDRFLFTGGRHFLRLNSSGACVDFPHVIKARHAVPERSKESEKGMASKGFFDHLFFFLSGSWAHLDPIQSITLEKLLLHREELERGNILPELDQLFTDQTLLIGTEKTEEAAKRLQDLERRIAFKNLSSFWFGVILLLLTWINLKLRPIPWLDKALWQLGILLIYNLLFLYFYFHGSYLFPILLPLLLMVVGWIPPKKNISQAK